MNLFVVLLLVVLVVLTVIAEVYCSMAETRRSGGMVTPVEEDQSIKVQETLPANGSVGTVRKIAC